MNTDIDQLIAPINPGTELRFRYKNWRGDTAVRHIKAMRLFYGATEWHKVEQWFVEGYDLDRGEIRSFAIVDMVPIHSV